jgi:hypothetical protein
MFLVSTTQKHHPFLELHHKNNILNTHIDQQGSVVPPPPVPDYDDNYLPEDGKMQQHPLLLVSQECLYQ